MAAPKTQSIPSLNAIVRSASATFMELANARAVTAWYERGAPPCFISRHCAIIACAMLFASAPQISGNSQ
ncbi:MAG TPA: hypothetical protein PLI95_23155, partial [Polyangiaceae bacterium]|nr:hypothetical protein [Polyangiaceae bacterium]